MFKKSDSLLLFFTIDQKDARLKMSLLPLKKVPLVFIRPLILFIMKIKKAKRLLAIWILETRSQHGFGCILKIRSQGSTKALEICME